MVRHGETEWNELGRYQGHSDVNLTPAGREQAHCLKRRFRLQKLDAIYASDLNRARETAEILAKPHNLKVNTLEELREINFGYWEGLTYQQIMTNYKEVANKWYIAPANLVVPGGESFQQLKDRAYNVVLQLTEKYPEQRIVIAAHGGTIRAIICAVLDLHLDRVWCLRQDNTAVNMIQFYEKRAVLQLFNDTHHLYEKKLT